MKFRIFYTKHEHRLHDESYYIVHFRVIDKWAERYQNFLANTLRVVANKVEDCDIILKAVSDAEKGFEPGSILDANEVELFIYKDRVQFDIYSFEDWIDNPDAIFSLEELKIAVTEWKRFLKMPESLDSIVEFEFL